MASKDTKLLQEILAKFDLDFASLIDQSINQLKESLEKLREINELLSEISEINPSIRNAGLDQLKEASFQVAGKYGITAADYLSSVKTMFESGYENAGDLAELSTMLQTVSGMTSDLANEFLIATDQAYGFHGSMEKLLTVLDGSNNITRNNVISLSDLVQGMADISTFASSAGIKIQETTAALAAMMTITQQSGSESAVVLKDIFSHIQKLTDLNPMEVLKSFANPDASSATKLSQTTLFDSLENSSSQKAFTSLIENWDTYEDMLQKYSNGTSYLAQDAEDASQSWDSSLNRLANTWTSTIANIADPDVFTSCIDALNELLTMLNKFATFKLPDIKGNSGTILDSWGSIGAGVGAFLSAKNLGRLKESLAFITSCFEYALHTQGNSILSKGRVVPASSTGVVL